MEESFDHIASMGACAGRLQPFALFWGCDMEKKNARPTEAETSAKDTRDSIDQGELFEGPKLAPSWPTPGTLDSIALEMLLTGQTLTHPDFQGATQSWRLAACVERIRNHHGWPVITVEIPAPTRRRPSRVIGEYHMRTDAIELVKGGTA
jgi:hypothetical protein